MGEMGTRIILSLNNALRCKKWKLDNERIVNKEKRIISVKYAHFYYFEIELAFKLSQFSTHYARFFSPNARKPEWERI